MTPEARARRRVRTPVLAATTAAWMVLAVGHWAGSSPAGHELVQSGHAHGSGMTLRALPTAAASGDPMSAGVSLRVWAAGWLVMLVAMMGPVLTATIRHVAARALPRRRVRAVGLVLLGYAVSWLLAGAVLTGASAGLRELLRPLGPTASILIAIGVAAAWQASPAKQRALNQHMALPAISATGRVYDAGVLRLGVVQGLWCVSSCWALMLQPLLWDTGHLAATAAVAVWIWVERFERPVAPTWRIRVPLTAARIAYTRAASTCRRW